MMAALPADREDTVMPTLYTYPYSQHCRRVLALLDEAGIDCRLEHVAMDQGEYQTPAFAAINPNRQIPTLVDGDVRVHESNAILRYLCLKHGLDDWYPTELAARATVEQWLDWNQCRFGGPVMDIVLNAVFLGDQADPAALARGRARLPGMLDILEQGLAGRRYLAGDQATIADLSVASNVSHLALAGVTPGLPGVDAWYARVCGIRGFRATLPPPMAA